MAKSGTGLGIARGIQDGANNFLQSFMAIKQFKEQQKYRKLAPIIDIINSQLADHDLPLDQRIKAMDSLPALLGAKNEIPLSRQLGLDKLAEQMVDTGEQNVSETRNGLVEDQTAVDANKKSLKVGDPNNPDLISTDNVLATAINQPVTKTLKKRSLKRRGELSANDLNIAKQVQINRAEQEDQFQRQYKLAQVQAGLQERTLAQQGWKNNGDWNFDKASNSWIQEWFNPITKETYEQKLQPGIVPETVILKQIQYGGSGSSGVSKAYSTLKQAVATSMGKEIDDPDVNLATANMWRNNFSLGVTNKLQDVTGTSPITKNQQFNNNMQTLQAQQKHAELVASASASLDNVNSLATRKGQAWQNAANAKADFDKVKNDNDPEDKEYQSAQAAYNRANDDANRLETEYQNALKQHNKLQEQVSISEQNLNKAGVNTSSTASEFSPQMRAAIAAVRKANPNTQLSDAQIADRIRNDPKYSHIK